MDIYNTNSTQNYYVYAYIRNKDSETAKKGTPYYIGKGKNKRAWNKHTFPIPKNNYQIVILETNLTEIGSIALERRMISWWGRKDLGTGILINLTDGGEGSSGRVFKHSEESKRKTSNSMKGKNMKESTKKLVSKIHSGKILSTETKNKISSANKGRKLSDETRQKMKNKKLSDETKKKISESLKGKSRSDETKKKISDSKKNR